MIVYTSQQINHILIYLCDLFLLSVNCEIDSSHNHAQCEKTQER